MKGTVTVFENEDSESGTRIEVVLTLPVGSAEGAVTEVPGGALLHGRRAAAGRLRDTVSRCRLRYNT